MSVVDFLTPAIQNAQMACEMDEKKSFSKAFSYYMSAIENLMLAIKYETIPAKKKIFQLKVEELMNRAQQIKEFLAQNPELKESDYQTMPGTLPSTSTSFDQSGGGTTTKNKKGGPDDETNKKLDEISSTILETKPNVRLDDVAGLDEAKDALTEAVIYPVKFPQFFVGKRTPWRAILLYGPPGTGKSFIAQAICAEANFTFFSVKASDIMNKWLGETEKLISALFKKAEMKKPSIIFLDEVDAFATSRSDTEHEASRRMKTELLIQMQNPQLEGVFLLAATNTPWALDPGFIRRFERRIYIGLPTEEARFMIFKVHIGDTPTTINDSQIKDLARKTNGFSGSDIAILVKSALYEPIRKCKTATHFKIVEGLDPLDAKSGKIVKDLHTPCSPGDPNAIEMNLSQVDPTKLLPPVVCFEDFLKALQSTSPSVDKQNLKNFEEFTKKFGFDGE